ncbi:MAG: ATP-dependent Clp protease adapter ClpS [Rickettsiales bacterium]|nr:ATP-dependent Clp protease adapter ClpS [Rickettsiales bacterium]
MAGGTQSDTLIAEPKVKVKRPSFYRVVLLNDDYTPMDFVVTILETIFRKTHEEAVQVMLEIHQKGAAVCGVFTRDIAETKADQVVEVARVNDYPLQCVIEPE